MRTVRKLTQARRHRVKLLASKTSDAFDENDGSRNHERQSTGQREKTDDGVTVTAARHEVASVHKPKPNDCERDGKTNRERGDQCEAQANAMQ